MGTLTEDINRLCEEITALKGARRDFMANVTKQTEAMKSDVASMRAGIRESHARMAAGTRAEQKKFVSNLVADVSGMLDGFHKAHADMAERTRKEGADFVSAMATGVSDLLKGFEKNRSTSAKNDKAQRERFVSEMKSSVVAARREFTADLNGARRAWTTL